MVLFLNFSVPLSVHFALGMVCIKVKGCDFSVVGERVEIKLLVSMLFYYT